MLLLVVLRARATTKSATRMDDRFPKLEAVAVGDQDGRGVPMPGAVLLGGLDEPLDLPVGQIFAAALANCYIYEVGAPS
jgi:hypothetical protein